MRFAMLARCLISSSTCRFLFCSLEPVVKSNVTVFVYTQRKQQQKKTISTVLVVLFTR